MQKYVVPRLNTVGRANDRPIPLLHPGALRVGPPSTYSMVHVMSEVKPVHRYKAQTMFSFGGAKIEYFPHGPEVVLATEFDAQRLRADTAEAENRILRHSNASFLETVAKACDLLGIDLDDAKHADGQPSDVLFSHAKGQAEKLAAAEQRIADTVAKLELAADMLDNDERGNRFAKVLRLAIAALNQKSEGESQ